VISSDLSHYYDYETACRLDVIIERGEWPQLTSDNACGFLCVAGLLIVAANCGLTAQRLALCNSADTAGGRDRVVGYGAWAF
jgi:MEMO1 family protein